MSNASIPVVPAVTKPVGFRARSLPGIVFAVLVILLALGSGWVGLYPWGAAVWIRPLVALTGVSGGLCLMWGVRWWRLLLPVWSGVQTWVVATDPSGKWFFQGIDVSAWESGESAHVNKMLVSYHVMGVNFAGPLLLGIVLTIMAFRLHPPLRGMPLIKRRKTWATLGLVTVAAAGLAAFERHTAADADAVLDLDLPHVPIYYQGELLGHTPLAITPALVRAHKLSLDPTRQLKLYGWGWADCEVLSDGVNSVELFAGPAWPFAAKLDVFETPWGPRARMEVGLEQGTLRSGQVWPRAALRNEPVLVITPRDTWPLTAR